MSSKTQRMLATLLFLAVGGTLHGCGDGSARIGAVLPLSGEAKTFGIAIEKGLTLALEELQQDPNYPIELEVPIVDSESDPQKAKDLLEEFYNNGAIAVIGGATSPEARAMIGVIDRYDRVLLSPSASSPELTGVSRNFYRIFPSDFRAASRMANFVTQQLKLTKIAVIAEDQLYAKGIQDAFRQEYERYGEKLVEVIEYPPHTNDFSGIVERLMTLDTEAVYLAAYDEAIGKMIQALRRADYGGRILTTSAFATPAAIARVGEDAVGVILTQTVFDLESEHAHVRAFVEAYRQKYGEDPDIYAAHGYDAMKVLAQALIGRPLLPSEVPKGLREEFAGVTGSIRFDDKGDVQKYPRLYIVGEDLGLYDYTAQVEIQKKKILEQRRKLQERLEKLRREARQIGGNG